MEAGAEGHHQTTWFSNMKPSSSMWSAVIMWFWMVDLTRKQSPHGRPRSPSTLMSQPGPYPKVRVTRVEDSWVCLRMVYKETQPTSSWRWIETKEVSSTGLFCTLNWKELNLILITSSEWTLSMSLDRLLSLLTYLWESLMENFLFLFIYKVVIR